VGRVDDESDWLASTARILRISLAWLASLDAS
jgi:hypothetical protein